MKLYSHVVTHDSGLAPNPFHGFCTSALCTPSHKKVHLEDGDWLIGNSPKKDSHRLVYAMHISQVLGMNDYFQDDRFQCKKPKPDGTPEEQCGDNIYYQDNDVRWKRLPSRFHNDRSCFLQDVGPELAGRPVFVAEHFYYFGRRRVVIPKGLAGVICDGIGIRDKSEFAHAFMTWLQNSYEPGILGAPRDIADHASETGVMITDLTFEGTAQTKNQKRGGCGLRPRSVTETQPRRRGCG